SSSYSLLFFFSPDTAPPEIYTLSLHDALPISMRTRREAGNSRLAPIPSCHARSVRRCESPPNQPERGSETRPRPAAASATSASRSEEHTSELQSLAYLVCRLLLEKKKKQKEQQ